MEEYEVLRKRTIPGSLLDCIYKWILAHFEQKSLSNLSTHLFTADPGVLSGQCKSWFTLVSIQQVFENAVPLPSKALFPWLNRSFSPLYDGFQTFQPSLDTL